MPELLEWDLHQTHWSEGTEGLFSAVLKEGPYFDQKIGTSMFGPYSAGGVETFNIGRNTGSSSKTLTIWGSFSASGCRFEAQALESPQI